MISCLLLKFLIYVNLHTHIFIKQNCFSKCCGHFKGLSRIHCIYNTFCLIRLQNYGIRLTSNVKGTFFCSCYNCEYLVFLFFTFHFDQYFLADNCLKRTNIVQAWNYLIISDQINFNCT